MMKERFRCDCPITSSLDIVGDKWILVIIKQMLIQHMQTFKEFNESDEAISTNILSNKLKLMEENGLIDKKDHPSNKKTKLYRLTEKGLALTPIIVELAIWSDTHLRDTHQDMRKSEELELMKKDRRAAIEIVIKRYREAFIVH